jgi:gliding motility-associated-like protein
VAFAIANRSDMKKLLRSALTIIFLTCFCSLIKAQTTLSPGDIAVVGYDFSYNTTTTAPIGSDNFDIVVLKDVAAGTVIQFASNGWTGSTFTSAGTIDGFFTWTVGSSITAGTIFNFSIANPVPQPATITVSPSNGTISGVTATEFTGTVGYSPSNGNQILIFQGTQVAPTFIYGINTNATNIGTTGWVTGVVGNNAAQSALPTGLTNANPFDGTVSAPTALPFTLATARYNAVYTGPLVGSQTTLLTDIGNYANWTATATATAPYDLSVGGANFSSSNPVFSLSSPTITTSGTLSPLSSTYGGASASGSFNVSGSNMSAGVLVTPPAGFVVSTDNSTFSNTVTVGAAGTIVSSPIYIRLKAGDAVGNYSGNVVLSSSGATSVNEAIASSAVTQAPLTITANNQTKVYGAAIPTLTASYTGFVNGDTPASLTTSPTLSTTATAASQVAGSPYSITASGAVDANYSISYVAGSLTVTQAPLTITANNQTKVYGAAIPTLTASYTGFVNGDTPASLTTSPTLSTPATAASQVAGSPYSITASGAVDANYSISYVAGSLTVTQATLTVTADNQNSTYGQALPALTVSYSGFVNGDTQASLTTAATASTTATAASPVGSYTITPSSAVDNNYAITYTNGTLTIGQAALTVTADNQSSTYGQALPVLTVSYSGFVNGDTQASLTTAAIASTTATAASPAGSYIIAPGGAVDNNYAITYTNGTLTVGQAALIVTAGNQSSTYGQALPALTVSYSGFVNGDTQASLTTAATASTTATAASPAGSYTITPSGAADNNYTISYTAGTLTIGKAALTITANNQNAAYGSALPTLTASYSGFVNGDFQANLTTQPTITTTATASSVAGAYPITASGAASGNYIINYVPGTLTIGATALTITVNNQTKVYGSANPEFTVSYSGFINGDDPSKLTTTPVINTPAATSSGAGNYPITADGASIPNYTIVYVPGTLTVTKAGLTVKADNKSRVYGAANPALTVSYSGFVGGDTQASLNSTPVAMTTATDHTLPGNYLITVSGGASPDYTFNYIPGTLTIQPLTNASLSNLTLDPATTILSPGFEPGTFSYTSTVKNQVGHLNLTATFNPAATASINGAPLANGQPSGDITLNTGYNTITVVVTAQDGKQNTYIITVYRGLPAADITATNILTPNGDGKNDTWVVKDIALYPNNTVTVFDRAGRTVYSKHGYNNDWDGTLKGAPLEKGTYYYTIDLGNGGNAIKGFITMVRNL